MIDGLPPIIDAAAELLVPRSIPIIFPISKHHYPFLGFL
jgi:hypothetical protein